MTGVVEEVVEMTEEVETLEVVVVIEDDLVPLLDEVEVVMMVVEDVHPPLFHLEELLLLFLLEMKMLLLL